MKIRKWDGGEESRRRERLGELGINGNGQLAYKGQKPTWKLGSSFYLKNSVKSLPKVMIDDEMDLIDEDNLLSEEDLKETPISTCCGRAEEEEKVKKLGITTDQSACGSVSEGP
ncbi:hypothetical protein Tco_1317810 [Tanacetum coccineum]